MGGYARGDVGVVADKVENLHTGRWLSVLFEATLSRSCDVNFGAKVGIRNLVVLFYFSGVIEKCNL